MTNRARVLQKQKRKAEQVFNAFSAENHCGSHVAVLSVGQTVAKQDDRGRGLQNQHQ